jgi:ATP-dependent Clp protease ATP-binding subunit ClpA
MVFEKLTQDSINVLSQAREEATLGGWDAMQVEHVLLGCLAYGKGIAAYALKKNSMHIETARELFDKQPRDDKPPATGDSSLSLQVESLLALANDFAMDRGDTFIDTEHLLLALLEFKNWRTRDVFDHFGVDLDRVRADVDVSIEHQLEVESSQEDTEKTRADAATNADAHLYSLFREDAMRVVMVAQEEARKLGHNFVGSEQLLLGVVEGSGAAAGVFKKQKITLNQVRTEVEKVIGRGSGYVVSDIPLTPKGKQILMDARDQALITRSKDVGPEHILLAILESEGIAARVLENMRVDKSTLKTGILTASSCESDSDFDENCEGV